MRLVSALALATAFTACTSDGMMGDDGDGSGSGSGSGSDTLDPPARGFQVKTPEVTIHAHEETTYCYYFKTSNTEAMSMKKWSSAWSAGSHHVILYFANSLSKTEGTIEQGSCGFGGGGLNLPQWIYSAQQSPSEMTLPADDGTGKPLGIDVAAGQAAMLEVHYNNTGDDDVVATATVNAEAHAVGVETTKTFAYVTYLADFTIPAGPTPTTLTNECAISPDSKVWLMTTHTHKNAIHTRVLDGTKTSTNVVFEATDWEHPGAKRMETPYYQFTTGKLTSECTWMNMTGAEIHEGQSAKTQEMCMASGYYFPATKAKFCYNGYVL